MKRVKKGDLTVRRLIREANIVAYDIVLNARYFDDRRGTPRGAIDVFRVIINMNVAKAHFRYERDADWPMTVIHSPDNEQRST